MWFNSQHSTHSKKNSSCKNFSGKTVADDTDFAPNQVAESYKTRRVDHALVFEWKGGNLGFIILIGVLFFQGIRARLFTYLKSRQRPGQGMASSDLDDCHGFTDFAT